MEAIELYQKGFPVKMPISVFEKKYGREKMEEISEEVKKSEDI